MDEILAQMYGTNVAEDDVEKLAAAQLAGELADEGEMDLAEVDDDEIEQLAQAVLDAEGDEGDEGEGEVEYEAADGEEEFAEKVAEADYLGRVMAHAYTQEAREIEKVASRAAQRHGAEPYVKGGIRKGSGGKSMKDLRGEAKSTKQGLNKLYASNNKGAGGINARVNANAARAAHNQSVGAKAQHAKSIEGKAGALAGKAKAMGGKVLSHLKSNKKAYGIGAGIAAATGGGAYMAGKRKAASALDTLAEQRALEILAENGIELQKTAGADEADVLATAVEQRAFELLVEAGYEFED